MKTRIRDLDFDAIVNRVAHATDAKRRSTAGGMFDTELQFVNSQTDAVGMLRDFVMLAALRHAKTLDDVQPQEPLVQAFVRVQHHPSARPFTRVKVQEGLRGPDAGPRLREIVDAHPELTWDADEVQSLIISAIRDEHGDHILDDSEPPWRMYWSPASAASTALFALVTLRTLGEV